MLKVRSFFFTVVFLRKLCLGMGKLVFVYDHIKTHSVLNHI